jgi:hypothetical protein
MEMVLFPKQYKCMWDEKCDEAARGEFPWLSKKGWLKKLLQESDSPISWNCHVIEMKAKLASNQAPYYMLKYKSY